MLKKSLVKYQKTLKILYDHACAFNNNAKCYKQVYFGWEVNYIS